MLPNATHGHGNIVTELRRRELIGSGAGTARSSWRPRFAMAAGVLIAALGGWVARGVVEATPLPSATGREYLLLLTEPEGLDTDKSMSELVGEYRDWAGGLAADGRLVAARHLDRGSQDLVRGESGRVEVSPTPVPTEATGFFLIRADSLDEARGLVADCPHLSYGGKISLSEVARKGTG